jgi:hypothetical protein
MEIELFSWKVKDLLKLKDKINPKPQYQRTPVWSKPKKKLLVDSMLRGYDLPKFYITETPLDPNYDYEVTDGQQRMRAIWEFASDAEEAFELDDNEIEGINTKGLSYSDLKAKHKDTLYEKFVNFKLSISIIKESTPSEVRSLFARLQMGDKLNPVELRHALSSNLGNTIFSVCENHPFFDESKIPNTRYKHQDYLDHAILLVYKEGVSNLKAPDLKQLYLDLANVDINKLQPIFKKTNLVLDMMKRVNSHFKGGFKNKWGFVDTFYLLYRNIEKIDDIKPKKFAENFKSFENKRKHYNKTPEVLIEDKSSLKYDKNMYDYILSFKSGGALKDNVNIRHRVFNSYFLNNENFKFKN